MDEGALAGALHTPPLPAGGLGGPSRCLRTAPKVVGFACPLGVAVRGLDESTRVCLAAAGPDVIVRGHSGPVTVPGLSTGRFFPLTGLGHG